MCACAHFQLDGVRSSLRTGGLAVVVRFMDMHSIFVAD